MGVDLVARGLLTSRGERTDPRQNRSGRARSTMTPAKLCLGILMMVAALDASPRAGLAQTDPKASADEHFRRGVELFRDRRFGDAATEFEEAYRLSPAYVVLYNIGQVNAALGRSVEAIDAYEKYLKQGAAQISPERTQEVQGELTKQRDRIGTVALRTTPEGAEIRMDGKWIGKTPLSRPVRATIGRHTFDAFLSGYAPQIYEIEVIGKAERPLEIAFTVDPAVTEKEAEAKAADARAAEARAQTAAVTARTAQAPVVTVLQLPRGDGGGRAGGVAGAGSEGPATSRSSINWQRTIGYVVAIGGLGTATAGGILAYQGANRSHDASDRLAQARTDAEYDAALPDFQDGKSRNRLGWIVAGLGGAGMIGGIILIATAPERPVSGVALGLAPLRWGGGGLSLHGTY